MDMESAVQEAAQLLVPGFVPRGTALETVRYLSWIPMRVNYGKEFQAWTQIVSNRAHPNATCGEKITSAVFTLFARQNYLKRASG